LTTSAFANLERRIAAMEAQRDRAQLPAVLIAAQPNQCQLRPEIEAALTRERQSVLILPIGRSATPDESGSVDPLIQQSKKFFIE
jgi:hypothetical protein